MALILTTLYNPTPTSIGVAESWSSELNNLPPITAETLGPINSLPGAPQLNSIIADMDSRYNLTIGPLNESVFAVAEWYFGWLQPYNELLNDSANFNPNDPSSVHQLYEQTAILYGLASTFHSRFFDDYSHQVYSRSDCLSQWETNSGTSSFFENCISKG